MIAAYAVILVGGLLITRRLALLGLAATFAVTLAIGLAIVTAAGHCMTANWAFAPVCGADFWRVVITSPEVLIFLFFMITDPKTVPSGRVGRLVFGALVAVTSTLLIAPQTDEWGAKVGLLSGLVVVCLARPFIDRFVPAPRPERRPRRRVRPACRRGGRGDGAAPRALGAGGHPRRRRVRRRRDGRRAGQALASSDELMSRLPTSVDPSTLPPITVGGDVAEFDHQLADAEEMNAVVVTLARNLELENLALLRRDDEILAAVDHGDRLVEMQERLRASEASGRVVVTRYEFDTIDVSLLVPFGAQTGLSLGLAGTGTMIEETRDADGNVIGRAVVAVRPRVCHAAATGDRWMNVAVLRPDG